MIATMALITANFRSAELEQETLINVILPEDCPEEDIKTVYLLHGMHGDHSSWCRKTSIERYATDRRLAIVMPDGENGFYTDMKYGKRHFSYVSRELVDYTRRIFKLSRRRERTFIAGLSMGGYGAFLLALRCPEQYAAAASLSGCLDIATALPECDWLPQATAIWGEDCNTTLPGSDGDLLHLLDTYREKPADAPRPRLFAVCGTEDSLYNGNLLFCERAKGTGIDFDFTSAPGNHRWKFWDKHIGPALDIFAEMN